MPLKKTEMLEDEKVKEVRTYTGVVSTRTSAEPLSNGEEGNQY